jgi:ubiquinone/menaquinone biosynthesis C-methylase UbiE
MGWGTSKIKGTKSLTGLDISPTAVDEAKTRYGEIADFREGSMEKLEFPEESFDIICCLEGIEHVPKAVGEAFIKEARRVLKKDGELLLSSPYCRNGNHSGNPYHLHEYQPDELENLLYPHFSVLNQITRVVGNLDVTYARCRKR